MGNIIISTTLKSENPVAHRCQHPLPLECFISSAFCKHSSLCWRLLPVSPASAKQGDRDCNFLFRQNVCTSGSSSSRRKQQQQQQQEEEEAAAEGSRSRSSGRRQQQQQQEAAATAAAAGGSSKEQQASSKQAESKQKAATSVCPVERIMKYNISFINQRNTKIELFLGARPKTMKSSNY